MPGRGFPMEHSLKSAHWVPEPCGFRKHVGLACAECCRQSGSNVQHVLTSTQVHSFTVLHSVIQHSVIMAIVIVRVKNEWMWHPSMKVASNFGCNCLKFSSVRFLTCTFRASCYSTCLSWAHSSYQLGCLSRTDG